MRPRLIEFQPCACEAGVRAVIREAEPVQAKFQAPWNIMGLPLDQLPQGGLLLRCKIFPRHHCSPKPICSRPALATRPAVCKYYRMCPKKILSGYRIGPIEPSANLWPIGPNL